jgi:hypothetical protein
MFPVYRKSIDSKNFFKILSNNEFIQVKIVGSKIKKFQYKVDKYPELILIKDLIDSSGDFYVISDEKEFENLYLLSK